MGQIVNQNSGTLLIVDDSRANLQLLETLLASQGYVIHLAENGQKALEMAHAVAPDLILLDVMMPEMNGYEVCLHLKEQDDLRDIPVIFISALDEVMDKVMGFRVGGVDYIVKPFQVEEIIARIDTHLELRWKRWEIERLREWEQNYYQKIMELKNDLVSTASHNIKTPLSNILNGVHLLRKTANLPPKQAKYVDMVQQGAERISALIKDLLDLTWVEASLNVQTERVSVMAFLQKIVDEASFEAQKKNHRLQLVPSEADCTIRVVPDRLSQAIENLLSNAIKYTPSEGTITVSIESRPREVEIRVTDTGLGIPPEDIPYIFDKFFRVQRPEHLQQPGSGLGMAIVQAIVEQHNGRIKVESELGKGSTFTIILPQVSG